MLFIRLDIFIGVSFIDVFNYTKIIFLTLIHNFSFTIGVDTFTFFFSISSITYHIITFFSSIFSKNFRYH